ncbi:hypothetical protein L7F22_013817 [Adiantum nelumboides]|nr:hypothetical protein [Adiantum nelumboides]
MSSHSRRCIIHPQQAQVGVCALCLRERLVALAESESSNVLSCSSNGSDGAFYSFSSSSARQPSPPPSSDHRHHNLKQGQTRASTSASFLHQLKLKALVSIPPSPDRAFPRNSAGLLYSPSPKNKPINGRKPGASEPAANVPFPSLNIVPNDRLLPPSTLPLDPHLQTKASLRSLFNQNEPTAAQNRTEHPTAGFVERTHEAPLDERRCHIEQFSEEMRSLGFAPSMAKAELVNECKQGYETGPEYEARPRSSWIASLFQRKKQKDTARSKQNAMASDVHMAANAAFETSARTSVDFARVSVDSSNTALNLKQMIRSRLQQQEEETAKIAARDAKHSQDRPPLANEHCKMHISPRAEQPQPTSNMSNCTYEFPSRSSISIGGTISVSGTRISSTARLGVEGEKNADEHDEAYATEQVRHLPRSRSCGRAWNRGQSPYSSIASPQHPLWDSSKQQLNNNTHTNGVKLSSIQQHYLTSTPKHPTMDNRASKDPRVSFGFYFRPFRRSKRQ